MSNNIFGMCLKTHIPIRKHTIRHRSLHETSNTNTKRLLYVLQRWTRQNKTTCAEKHAQICKTADSKQTNKNKKKCMRFKKYWNTIRRRNLHKCTQHKTTYIVNCWLFSKLKPITNDLTHDKNTTIENRHSKLHNFARAMKNLIAIIVYRIFKCSKN